MSILPGLINAESNFLYWFEVIINMRPGVSLIPSHKFKISSNVMGCSAFSFEFAFAFVITIGSFFSQ